MSNRDLLKPTNKKTSREVAQEWDNVAKLRYDMIHSGQDPSFEHILAPAVLEQLEFSDNPKVLDIGCGTGDLTSLIASKSFEVTAIEPSSQSLKLARETCSDLNITFFEGTIQEFVASNNTFSASTLVSAMTLMCVVDIESFAAAVSQVAVTDCLLITTLTHPFFWPRYWGYENKNWFDYSKEIFVEAPFRTSKSSSGVLTTHIHRPLETYIGVFSRVGFALESLIEPVPSPKTEEAFPTRWKYPRFLVLRWRKISG